MKSLLGLIILFLSASASASAIENGIIPAWSHTLWDRASGFPASHVYSMTQTGDGYLWLGTGDGLLRYDGLNFEFIRREPTNDLTNGLMPRVLTDATGQLWVTDDFTRLFRYRLGSLNEPVSDNSRHEFQPSAMSRTNDGWLLFVSLLQGVVEYKHGEPRTLLQPSALPAAPTAVAQTADGTIWIGTAERGLFRFTPERGEPSLLQVPGMEDKRVNCLLSTAHATVLAGTTEGLFSARNGDAMSEANSALAHVDIVALTSGMSGRVWIGTEDHVFEVQATDINAQGKISSLDPLLIPVNRTVTALLEDRDGNLWIAEPGGLERYQGNAFITYGGSGLPCNECGAIYVDYREDLWFAPPDGGLFRMSHGRVETIAIPELKNDIVYSIAGAGDEVWVARRGGITHLDLQGNALQASTVWPPNAEKKDAVYSLYREGNGTLWAGTLHQGLGRFHDGVWHFFTKQDGLPSDKISAVTGDGSGRVFAGTADGLAEFTHDHWISFHTHDGVPPGAIQSLLLDSNSTLWIGTARGLGFLRDGSVHVPIGAPAALYGEILAIAERDNWLWITTPSHILRVRCSALLQQSLNPGDYREFSVDDGLPSTAGVKRSNSVARDDRGNLWFSLQHGISLLPASAFAHPAFPVTVRIERMLVDSKTIPANEQIRIPSGHHRLTFQYAGVDVSNPERLKYRYRLADLESSWSEPTALRDVDFTNTGPGHYEFQVAAINQDGVWNQAVAALKFSVLPAFYQTNGFRVLCLFAFLTLLWAIYQLRLQQLHRQFNIALDARVEERTRIARELHDTLLQNFHGLMFQYQAASNMMERRPDDARHALNDAIGETKKALTESRNAIQGLRSGRPVDDNFAELLTSASRELTNSMADGHPPVFHLLEEGDRQPLAPPVSDEIFRIALELLRNAYQHAHAQRIETEIRYQASLFRLRIRDDGAGIDPTVLKDGGRSGHWGLRGVRERADRIGAHLDLWSQPGKGTEVQLLVPASIAYQNQRDSFRAKLVRKVKSRVQRS